VSRSRRRLWYTLAMTGRRVVHDGIELAVYEWGDPAAPTILLVHGYPDNHRVWMGVAERLAPDWHVVAYDTRGTGASTAPADRRGYRLDRLAGDLVAVLGTLSPPVHLVGHDWGSVQAWEVVCDPAVAARLASYTSMSGPCLAHLADWWRRAPAGQRAGQLLRSAYIGWFRLPVLPELAWRGGFGWLWRRVGPGAADTLTRDAVRGLQLYRANAGADPARRECRTDLPVQLLVLRHDPFISPHLFDDLTRWAPRLTRYELDAGHWAPRSRPAQVAERIATFARANPGTG
jgi:pimeloyl-ACP methyl ester carboxylesterase